jgi:hypothetical protein
MLCRDAAWPRGGQKSRSGWVFQKRRNSPASNRYAQQLRRKMSEWKISRNQSRSRVHFAERTVTRRQPCKSQRGSGLHRSRNVCLTFHWPLHGNPYPSGGSRLRPSKADSRCDQKGKHRASCPLESDSPCILQGNRVLNAGSHDYKTIDAQDIRCDRKSA